MVLNSMTFLIFFTIFTIIFFIFPYKHRWILFLIGNYYFYTFENPKYIIILLVSTLISYICGLAIDNKELCKYKKFILAFALIVNIGFLFSIKYLKLVLGSIEGLFHMGNTFNVSWIVPLGISFYTFQTLSYLMDVYRGKIRAERHLGYYAVYVSFFLTIVSGPIERGAHLVPQLHKESKFDYDRVTSGMRLILWGLFKKLVIADGLSAYVDLIYNNVHKYTGWPLLFATVFFAFQLYCDFSGYTNIAIGCAKILGIDLIENFNIPYLSQNIQEFWKRWHISLSTWFRDYLYIPLGGNKVSKVRWYFNLFIVFLVSGIWHGANWTFAIWGSLHGIYQIIGKLTKKHKLSILEKLRVNLDGKFLMFSRIFITFCLVDFAWIFFRASSVNDAVYIVSNMFHNLKAMNFMMLGKQAFLLNLLFIIIIACIDISDYNKPEIFINRLKNKSIIFRWGVYYCLIFLIIIFGSSGNATFIYKMF